MKHPDVDELVYAVARRLVTRAKIEFDGPNAEISDSEVDALARAMQFTVDVFLKAAYPARSTAIEQKITRTGR